MRIVLFPLVDSIDYWPVIEASTGLDSIWKGTKEEWKFVLCHVPEKNTYTLVATRSNWETGCNVLQLTFPMSTPAEFFMTYKDWEPCRYDRNIYLFDPIHELMRCHLIVLSLMHTGFRMTPLMKYVLHE